MFLTPAAKERDRAQKVATQRKASQTPSSSGYSTPTSQAMSPIGTPTKSWKKAGASSQQSRKSGATSPARTNSGGLDYMLLDLSAANLQPREDESLRVDEPVPRIAMGREKLLEEARRELQASGQGAKKGVSLVVIGHVDAGKSTLMGRLLYELGRVDEKSRHANERESNRAGKSSFSWAWELDGTKEERERGITMDIAIQSLSTAHRQITILDAPGHKDFIPNMISGASQADCALLVVDAAKGEFEAGFERGGQTREHLVLVRSLGASQVVVAVNKLDQVDWGQARYEEVCEQLKTFFGQSGFQSSKTSFVPVGAMLGVNLVERKAPEASALSRWYRGPTLVDLLDKLEPPARDIESPLRVPISNVFKGQSSGIGVTGRICGGIVQVGERLRVLPGDETAVVKSIDLDEGSVSWAAAGSNATLYLTAIDPIHLNIGSVLCPLNDLVPLATRFSTRIIVFDIQLPITSGASVELFHHSRDVPATISKLVASIDRATGSVTRKNPRVLIKGTSAEIEITLRGDSPPGTGAVPRPIPIEPFAVNKDMGRILLRRGGETIAAGGSHEDLSHSGVLKQGRNRNGNPSMKFATDVATNKSYATQYVHGLRVCARSAQIMSNLQI
ncbi:P-loop containing nucleoside triphosphate hydrolase protein [Lanmaoa asiatica]|nr:P-loop containing nucleoside triphosphate hydrolase protein [Lanmaoa asiatica]